MRPLVRVILRGSLSRIRHVDAVTPATAGGLVAAVYAQARREFGAVAPPLALHSPAPQPLAAAWLLLRETLLAEGRVSRADKEAVATAVSRANDCAYCTEVHQAALATLPAAPAQERLAAWVRRGGTRPPFTPAEAPEILGTAVTFHYLTRMVRLFLPENPVPGAAPSAGRDAMMRLVARSLRPEAGVRVRPGAARDLLPAAPLPPRLQWAHAHPALADALARASAAVDDAARWIPVPVRTAVESALTAYGTSAPGPSRAWLDQAGGPLDPAHRPAARLALLTALGPHQATDSDIAAFRARHPGDAALIQLTSFAALRAATEAGARLAHPAPTSPRAA
ncbi:carboxymuconolactone decarboxylase family protein [Streptomyces sp. NPDC057638]|uniref:carboxymuconolactone decarboxylase family protein n=1 Tax=Streptomyces sp. NPDC057638 TaxID=3346190 RepID=UPI0036C2FA29